MHNWLEIQQQIEQYAMRMVELYDLHKQAVDESVGILRGELSANWEMWKEAALNCNKHLIPDFDEAPNTLYPVMDHPVSAVLLSSDGSQIFPNRHEIASLALITVSRIRIDYHHYRDMPLMDSRAKVYLHDDFNEIVGLEREISFEDSISDQRTLEELETLASLAEEQKKNSDEIPVIALSDGSLILWRLAERFERDYETRMIERYIENLQRFQQCQVPIAGYISSSGSREVVNLVRLVQESLNSDWITVSDRAPVLTDIELFYRILKKGTRTTLFHSQSKIVREKYGDQRISYFYLHVGDEIAKVEIPQWIAIDRQRVDQVAAYCYQQAQIGGGYPIVLSEAHEHAVVRGPDRETFYVILEDALRKQNFDPRNTAKQLRKRVPMT